MSTRPNRIDLASGSPLYAAGTGNGSGTFTITSGDVLVDEVRFQVNTADNTSTLLEFFVPVDYHFGDHAIYNVTLSPCEVGCLMYDQHLDIEFDYFNGSGETVRIWARPFSGDHLTPDYAASGSPAYGPGGGSGAGFFTIQSGPALVDRIRFQMWNDAYTELLLEVFVPLEIEFQEGGILDWAFEPPTPAGMRHPDDVYVNFTYACDDPGGARVFVRPFTEGSLSPNYSASGSPLYPIGVGGGEAHFRITGGEITIDAVRFTMTNADQTQVMAEYFVPVNFHYAADAVFFLFPDHLSPAWFTYSHHAGVEMPYYAADPSGVRIWALPYRDGSYASGAFYSSSPVYPSGYGTATNYVTAHDEPTYINQICVRMTDPDQTISYVDWLVDTEIYFGNQATSAVGSTAPPAIATRLFMDAANPIRGGARIAYHLPQKSYVALRVSDVMGRQVDVYDLGLQDAGPHDHAFEAGNLGTGMYFMRLELIDHTGTLNMVDHRRVMLTR